MRAPTDTPAWDGDQVHLPFTSVRRTAPASGIVTHDRVLRAPVPRTGLLRRISRSNRERLICYLGGSKTRHALEHYLKTRFYIDIAAGNPGALRLAIETYGIERLVFGSGYPSFRCPRCAVGSRTASNRKPPARSTPTASPASACLRPRHAFSADRRTTHRSITDNFTGGKAPPRTAHHSRNGRLGRRLGHGGDRQPSPVLQPLETSVPARTVALGVPDTQRSAYR
jgi:hypothetical protein